MKRPAKIVLGVVLLIVLGFVVVPMIFLSGGGSYRREVEAYKRDLLAKGEKLTIAELVPQPTPGAVSNATRFLNAASSYSEPFDFPSFMKRVAPGVALVDHTNFSSNQIAGYERNVGLTANLRKALEVSVLDFSADYVEVGRRNASSLALYLSKLKSAELLAEDTAMQALYRKDSSEAVADLNVAVDIVRLNIRERLLIADLIRAADASIATAATWEALQSDQLNDRQLAGLEEKWQGVELFGSSESALSMEMAMNVEAYAWFRKSANPFSSYITAGTGQPDWFDAMKQSVIHFYDQYPRYWAWRSSWSFDEELCCLETYEAQLKASRTAKSTGAFVPALNSYDLAATNIIERHRNGGKHFELFDSSNVESLRNYLTKLADAETSRRLTVIAIALKRHQLARKAYPASLNELVPQYLAEVPADFMDGKPLRYKLQPNGSFLLYSVGDDGEDNGGDPTTDTGNFWLRGRDIVWPRAATAKEIEDYQKAQKQKAASLPTQ